MVLSRWEPVSLMQLAVEGILSAKATFGMGFEQFDTVLEGLTVGMSGSVKIYLIFYTHEWPVGDIWNYHWPENAQASGLMTSKSINLRSG